MLAAEEVCEAAKEQKKASLYRRSEHRSGGGHVIALTELRE